MVIAAQNVSATSSSPRLMDAVILTEQQIRKPILWPSRVRHNV
jgi:hypothetical protein